MNEDLEGALRAYLQCLEEKEYFEAHEVLEEAWHPLRLRKDPLANFMKGLINAAIAFEHLKRNRPGAKERARRVFACYLRHKISAVPDMHKGLYMQVYNRIEVLRMQYSDVFGGM